MTIRTTLLSTLALAVLAGPALAQEGPKGHPGHPDGPRPGHDRLLNADTDGDGQLSRAEFMAIHEKRFEEMDANKDGQISKDEMKAHRETMKAKFKEKRQEWEQKRKETGDVPPPPAGE